MPNIEIISIRLNLDKDDDRDLFEKLQKQLGKVELSRNEFLKHSLLDCLSGRSRAGKAAARPTRSRRSERPKPAKRMPSSAEMPPEKADESGLSEADAAALAASFVN